ncbi:hypothetical protein [Lysinibacillus xylanilyticus]|uniref:hypothetical protein n=1 Tax=Lysinibacillus xylanilyticus TaxID=582475 RepID=UPI0038090A06
MGISVTDETLERAHRGTKVKSITSCDNAFVTNILLLLSLRCTSLSRKKHLLPQAAHRTPPGSSALRDSNKCFICAKAKRQQQMFSVAKAKRQQQSAQPERKSTPRYGDESLRRTTSKCYRFLDAKYFCVLQNKGSQKP